MQRVQEKPDGGRDLRGALEVRSVAAGVGEMNRLYRIKTVAYGNACES